MTNVPDAPDAAAQPVPTSPREAELARAEGRGRQVLLYVPEGPLGGAFTCTRCAATALQPDLLDHQAGCSYRSVDGRGGSARRPGEATADAVAMLRRPPS
ncbi:MAG: hypothetical protein ABI699_11985 [Caldimonas sp.]